MVTYFIRHNELQYHSGCLSCGSCRKAFAHLLSDSEKHLAIHQLLPGNDDKDPLQPGKEVQQEKLVIGGYA